MKESVGKEDNIIKKENILVSACLLGVHCRYDGKCQQIQAFDSRLPELMRRYHVIPVCPEVYGGLATPRCPAEIVGTGEASEKLNENGLTGKGSDRSSGKAVRRVATADGTDVTEAFYRGAVQTLQLAKLYGCRIALLKERSPSCGSSAVYDGTFSKALIPGDGITAALLKENGIRELGESEISELLQKF